MNALLAATFLTVLGGTVLIPAARPFFFAVHPASEGAIHAFMSVNMLGGALGAPLVAYLADRARRRRSLAIILLAADATLMLLCTLPLPLWLTLALRTLQGGASVGALSIVMGALGRKGEDGRLGAAGAAVVSAIAAGAPLGSACVQLGPRAALHASALFSFCACLLVFLSLAEGEPAKRPRLRLHEWRDVRLAAVFIALERFGVGGFVVTFSLYAHDALAISDAQIGLLYSLFLVPFAAFSLLASKLLRAMPRGALFASSGVVYGACIGAFGHTSGVWLGCALFLAGVASSAIYAPSLLLAAEAVPRELRATAMGIANAAGTLGMMTGTALGGAASALAMREGLTRIDSYRLVFVGAGAIVALGFVLTSASGLLIKLRKCD